MGFIQFLWYAENMVRVIEFELNLGVLLGHLQHSEVEDLIFKYKKLRCRIRNILDGSKIYSQDPVH